MFEITASWNATFPNAYVGVLIMRNTLNLPTHSELDNKRIEIEEQLRNQFLNQDRAKMSAHPILQAYNMYYKQFKKSYHVQMQIESIALKGKSIPRVSTLVQAMFMAEVKNMLLTAGHDLDTLQFPLILDVSKGNETYQLMRGEEQILKANDMFIRDSKGIISSIIYGPDKLTQITSNSKDVIFTVYAPSGIKEEAVLNHLEDIQNYIKIVAPESQTELLQVYSS